MQKQYILQASINKVLPIDDEYLDKDVSARKNSISKRPKLQDIYKILKMTK
ncbi:hypothetical protein KHA80_06230 [Anaerobacillus sp. HL2]|nr:hypothetical protein KHA80_06230 [Anaerobacillus sp. HL2]